jgi:hypothetical protein
MQQTDLSEAKFTKEKFAITKYYGKQLKLKKTIFTTILTTYPALKNKYYLEEMENEISMYKLFEPN